jgi:hypothetical protein
MFLICIDPLTSVVCGSIFSVVALLQNFGYVGSSLCDVFYLSLHTPSFVGVVSTALVAVIRFITIQR